MEITQPKQHEAVIRVYIELPDVDPVLQEEPRDDISPHFDWGLTLARQLDDGLLFPGCTDDGAWEIASS